MRLTAHPALVAAAALPALASIGCFIESGDGVPCPSAAIEVVHVIASPAEGWADGVFIITDAGAWPVRTTSEHDARYPVHGVQWTDPVEIAVECEDGRPVEARVFVDRFHVGSGDARHVCETTAIAVVERPDCVDDANTD